MRKLLLSFVLFAMAGGVSAQNEVRGWKVTPKVGLNITSMSNTDNSDPRFGLAAGAEAEYQATPWLGISFGAIYSMQGVKASSDEGDGTIKMDYINVPILANFYVAKGFALKVGLQPGFRVNDKVKVSSQGVSAEVGLKDVLRASGSDADVKSFDLAIPIGLSYEFSNGIKLDARYNWSVTEAISVEDESTKHSVLQFTVGYSFKL